jgi:TrmH family RNA methyltransferase
MTITSTTNKHVKEIRRLRRTSARAKAGRFVAEGEDLVMAADAAGRVALYVACAPGLARGRANWLEATPEVLGEVSILASGARVVAVYEQRWSPVAGPLAIALWGVRDPGNVGTVIRAAHSFGASSVALGPDCADPHSPKAVRASMGAIFATPLARFDELGELPRPIIALVPTAPQRLLGPISKGTLLLGGERAGLPADLLAGVDEQRAIRQASGDSLNAAMAATVALYEATRMAAP